MPYRQDVPLTDRDGNVTYPRTTAESVHLGDTTLEKMLSNPNLLDNWYFGPGVINQRGQSSYAAPGPFAYGIDRWKQRRCTLTVQSGCCNVQSTKDTDYKRITQMSEGTLLANQTYTLSALLKVKGIGGSTTRVRPCDSAYGIVAGVNDLNGRITETTTGYQLITNTFTPAADAPGFGVEILTGNTAANYFDLDIKAVKLELGPVSTLAYQNAQGTWVLNDPPPNPALELVKCQRYQIDMTNAVLSGMSNLNGDRCFLALPLPTAMRAKPTVSNCKISYITGGGTWIDNPAIDSFQVFGNVASPYLQFSVAGLAVKQNYAAYFTQLFLDANL